MDLNAELTFIGTFIGLSGQITFFSRLFEGAPVCDKINQMAVSKIKKIKKGSVKPQLQGEKYLFQTKHYQETVALL